MDNKDNKMIECGSCQNITLRTDMGDTGYGFDSCKLCYDTSFKNYTLEQVRDMTLEERHTEIREIYNDGRITTDIFIKHLEMREQMIKVKMFLTEINKQ